MKIKITFLAVLFGLPIFAFAATQYAPARTALRAQAIDSAEYYARMTANMKQAETPLVIPDYMMGQYAQPTAQVPVATPSYAMPAPVNVAAVASANGALPNVTAGSVTAETGDFKKEVKAPIGHFGKDSVYIGSDKVGNYIKATGTAAKNFLRIMIGTTKSNAVEVLRILANGNMRMIGNLGILVDNPQSSIHIANSDALPASIRFSSQNSGLTATDGAVIDFNSFNRLNKELNFKNYENAPIRFLSYNGGNEFLNFIINPNGNVGIGTSNPLSRFHIFDYSENSLKVTGQKAELTVGTRDESVIISARQIPNNDSIGGITFETRSPIASLQPLQISNDGRVYVNNEICLPNGIQVGKSICFKYACPAANGQWTLSQTACGPAPEPGMVSANINSSFSSPTYAAGANSVRLGSFVIAETTGNEDLQIVELSFDKDMNSNFDIQNLRAKIGSQQIGSTQAIVADGGVPIEFTASAPLPIVPKNGSIIVDLYGDILSSTTAGTHTSIFDLLGGAVKGASSGSSIAFPSSVNGQNVVIGAGATLTLTTSANSPSSRYLVIGSSDNVLYSLNLAASNAEDVRVTDIAFRDVIANNAVGIASFNNLELYDDTGTLLSGPVNMTTTGSTGGDIVFSLGSTSSLIIPKNSSKMVTLKGDVATFVSGGAKSGSSHVFGVSSPFNVTAYGKDSSVVASVTGTPSGSAQTVYRTKPTLTSSVLGATTGRTRVAVDEIASMVWGANAADDITISTVRIKLSGSAVSSGTTPFSVSLIDANTNGNWGNATAQTCSPAANQCVVSFSPAFSITRGSSKAVKLRVNSSAFFNGANSSDSLSAIINAASDILWSDGTTTGISWEAVQIPIALTNVSYQ